MKKFILSILFILLITIPGFAQYGQVGGGISGITLDGNTIVFGSPADSVIFEIPVSAEASFTFETLIGTSFKIFNAEKDTIIINPDGFKAGNSTLAGIYVFQYGSAGGDTARIDSNAVISTSGNLFGATYGSTGAVTDAELLYVADVTSLIQAQLDLKAPLANPVFTGSFTSPGIDDNADDIAITIDVTTEKVNFSADADVVNNITAGDMIIDEAAGVLDFTGATNATISSSGAGILTLLDSVKVAEQLLFANEIPAIWGTNGDVKAYWNDAIDDQWIVEFKGTTAATDDDAIAMFLFPASPDADQELWEIAKGTQESKTSLFKVDEDGDGFFLNILRLGTGLTLTPGQEKIAGSNGNDFIDLDAALWQTSSADGKIDMDEGAQGTLRVGDDGDVDIFVVDGLMSYDPNALSNAGTSVADDAAITVTHGIMRMVGADADALLDTDPAVNDGAIDGQIVIIQGTADGNTVTIADNVNTQLAGGVNMTLGDGDVLCLMWDSNYSMWIEQYRADN